jgi:hypothetical protein
MIMPDKKIEQKNQVKIPRKNPAKKYIGGFQHDWFQRQAGYMPQFPMEAVGLGKRGVLAMDLCSGSPTVARSEGFPIPLLRPRIPGIINRRPSVFSSLMLSAFNSRKTGHKSHFSPISPT